MTSALLYSKLVTLALLHSPCNQALYTLLFRRSIKSLFAQQIFGLLLFLCAYNLAHYLKHTVGAKNMFK